MNKVTFVVPFLLLIACGGSTPPVNNNTVDASGPPQSSDAGATVEAAAKVDIEQQRSGFIETCMKRIEAPAYCACAFDQFKEVFKDADLTQKPSDAQLMQLKQKTIDACPGKLTEEEAKKNFLTNCNDGNTRKNAYCDCTWGALRKTLSVADFLSDFEGPRFDAAKKDTAKVCKGKLPDDVAKADFIGGCTKAAPTQGAMCECVWKKMRAKASPEEILASTVDAKPMVEACKAGK